MPSPSRRAPAREVPGAASRANGGDRNGRERLRRAPGGIRAGGLRAVAGSTGSSGVGDFQRGRIVVAMADLVRERGVSTVTVAHIVERSGVSRRTFYEIFENREDCFDAALDRALAKAGEAVLPAYEACGSLWRARIAAGLEAALVFLDAEPELGYLCVVAALGAGPGALERRARMTEALVAAVHEGRLESRAARRPDRLVAEGVVGAVLAILYARLQARDSKPLLGLRNALMASIVLPYLGAGAAERELKRPAPRAQRSRSRGARKDALRELDMRLTYRTVRVLLAIAELDGPGSSDGRARGSTRSVGGRAGGSTDGRAGGRGPNNRQVAGAAGVADQGQISKLLARLQALGLIANTVDAEHAQGEPNAWTLTAKGEEITRALQAQAV